LQEIHIVDGSILKVDDFLQNYELSITVSHKEQEKDKPEYEIVADLDQLKPKAEEGTAETDNNGAADHGLFWHTRLLHLRVDGTVGVVRVQRHSNLRVPRINEFVLHCVVLSCLAQVRNHIILHPYPNS
jgi:hypothetical protein